MCEAISRPAILLGKVIVAGFSAVIVSRVIFGPACIYLCARNGSMDQLAPNNESTSVVNARFSRLRDAHHSIFRKLVEITQKSSNHSNQKSYGFSSLVSERSVTPTKDQGRGDLADPKFSEAMWCRRRCTEDFLFALGGALIAAWATWPLVPQQLLRIRPLFVVWWRPLG